MTNTTHAKRSEDYLYGVDGRDPEGKVVVRRIEITSLVFQAVAA
jgi:hypothetical protein